MSFIVAPGTGSTPPVTTRVGMPSLCESTAKIVRVYRERHSGWLKGRAHVKAKRAKLEFESLREMVLQGEVTREQIMLTDEWSLTRFPGRFLSVDHAAFAAGM